MNREPSTVNFSSDLTQPLLCPFGLLGLWKLFLQVVEDRPGPGFVPNLKVGIPLFQHGAGYLGVVRMPLDEKLELLDRLVVVLLAVIRLAQPVLGIWQQAGLGIEGNVISEAVDREVIVAFRIIIEGIPVQFVRSRGADH